MEVLESRKKASVIAIFKAIKEDPGNYRSASVTSVLRKIMECAVKEPLGS